MQPSRNGFSMTEVVVAIVVVALAAPPMMTLFHETLVRNADAHKMTMAVGLATGLMEEVLSKAFEDPEIGEGSFGAEEGSRASYDDVDDYDDLNVKPPRDSRNNVLGRYSNFRTRVAVQNVQAADPGGNPMLDGATDFKRVTVTVLWDNGSRFVRLVGMTSKVTPSGYPPQTGLTYIERVWDSSDDVRFRVRNDTGEDLYLTHLTITWDGGGAWYSSIDVSVEGYDDYGTVWTCLSRNFRRLGSGETAHFNLGDIVLVPDGRVAQIEFHNFRNNRVWPWGSSVNTRGTPATVEVWAAPYTYYPFVVEALQ
jgi:MSHA pilin protein MshD